MEDTHFDSFDALLDAVKGVTFEEAMALGFNDLLQEMGSSFKIEDWNGQCAITACGDSEEPVKALAETFNLVILTYIVSDEGFSLTTGLHRVNREYFLFGWDNRISGYADEEDDCEYDDEGNIIS